MLSRYLSLYLCVGNASMSCREILNRGNSYEDKTSILKRNFVLLRYFLMFVSFH